MAMQDKVKAEMGPYADAIVKVAKGGVWLNPPQDLQDDEIDDFNERAMAAYRAANP